MHSFLTQLAVGCISACVPLLLGGMFLVGRRILRAVDKVELHSAQIAALIRDLREVRDRLDKSLEDRHGR